MVPLAAAAALRCGSGGPGRTIVRLGAAFLAWTALTALVGVDRWYALAGTPERHAGLLLWVLLALAFVTGVRAGRAGGGRGVAQGAALAAAVVGAWSTVELLWRAPVVTDAAAGRLGGPFGSAAFLGAACCLLGPVAAGVAFDRATARSWRAVGLVGASGSLAGLAGSGTRGAWLGATAATVAVAAARWPAVRRRWRGVTGVVLAALALGALVAVSGPRHGPGATVLRRTTSDTARLDEWRIAWRAVLDRPILGTGPEGYRVVFPRLVDDRYERTYGRTVIPDRAHDAVLDVVVAVGVPGLLLYLALLATVGRSVVRALRRGDAVLAGTAVGLVAYVAQQVVLFPLAELEPVAWLLAGVVVAADAGAVAERAPARAAATVLGALAVLAAVAGALDLAADRSVRTALAGGRTPAVIAAAGRRAAVLRPDQVRYRIAAARALAPVDRAAALAQLDAAAHLSPHEPALAVERAELVATVPAWRAALATDPRRGASWLQLGLAAASAGDPGTAAQAWARAGELAPRDPVPWLDLALLALDQGRLADARAALAQATARAAPGDARIAGLAAEVARRGG